jgi:hypothetical protein
VEILQSKAKKPHLQLLLQKTVLSLKRKAMMSKSAFSPSITQARPSFIAQLYMTLNSRLGALPWWMGRATI